MTVMPISAERINQQAIKFYFVLLIWPVYLFFLPPIVAQFGFFSLLYMIFPGAYLFTWVGYLLHESWHKYVPTINNRFFYNAFSLLILSDPQVYNLVHPLHHAHVHTYEDREFHPLGEIKNRAFRTVYHWLEFVFGVAFLILVASLVIPHDHRFAGKYRFWKLSVSLLAAAAFLGGIGYLSHLAFGVSAAQIALAFGASFWLHSFFLHQSQLIEHGNLIVEGPPKARNLWTRNLKPAGVLEKIVLFFTHNDSREHVLHHTAPHLYLRPFPGETPLPEESRYITMKDYAGIVKRMLGGIEEKQVAD